MSCCMSAIPVLPFLLIFGLIFRAVIMRGRRAAEARRELAEYEIIKIEETADFKGQRSLGSKQDTGKGVLALTPHKLYFLLWLPKVEIEVYVSAMTSVELVDEFMGKPDKQKKKLLQVNFENDAGQPDAMAWQVPEHEEWEKAIHDVISKT